VAQRGGHRVGAGLKPGTRTRLQQTAIDVAAQVLNEADALAIWKKLIQSQSCSTINRRWSRRSWSTSPIASMAVPHRPSKAIRNSPSQFKFGPLLEGDTAGDVPGTFEGSVIQVVPQRLSNGETIRRLEARYTVIGHNPRHQSHWHWNQRQCCMLHVAARGFRRAATCELPALGRPRIASSPTTLK
jgi:hypothetical protein